MNRATWVVVASTVMACIMAFLNFTLLLPDEPAAGESALRVVARLIRPHAGEGTFFLTLGIVFANGFVYWLDRHRFRVDTVEAVLQDLVDECGDNENGRRSRASAYRSVSGWHAFVILSWRLLRTWDQEDMKPRWELICKIDLFQRFLVVYGRSTRGKNKATFAHFRVSDQRGVAEGIAGLAWVDDWVAVSLPKISREDVLAIQSQEAFDELGANTLIKRYAREGNIRNLATLQRVQHFNRHFLGCCINSRKRGEPWGVLVFDSEADTAPWAKGERAEVKPQDSRFGRQFSSCSSTLGHLIT